MPGSDRSVTKSLLDAVMENVGRVAGRVQEQRSLRSDLLESSDAYLIVVDAPGAERQDIDVRYRDGDVTVTVERFREFREGFSMRFPGRGLSLRGTVTLPADADINPDAGRAELDDTGTLRIYLPKASASDGESATETAEE